MQNSEKLSQWHSVASLFQVISMHLRTIQLYSLEAATTRSCAPTSICKCTPASIFMFLYLANASIKQSPTHLRYLYIPSKIVCLYHSVSAISWSSAINAKSISTESTSPLRKSTSRVIQFQSIVHSRSCSYWLTLPMFLNVFSYLPYLALPWRDQPSIIILDINIVSGHTNQRSPKVHKGLANNQEIFLRKFAWANPLF